MTTPKGYTTSEFALSAAAILYNLLLAGGIIPHSQEIVTVVSSVASLLGAFGYSALRTWLKAQQPPTVAPTAPVTTSANPTGGV
jgi:hypothetical protein